MQLDRDLLSQQEMRMAVEAAKKAQRTFESFSQEEVDRIVKAMADAAYEKAFELARMAVEETGLGVIEHKVLKNQVASREVFLSIAEQKTVGILQECKERNVVEVASPFGVIAGIVPVTNPTSTTIFKSLTALKARNAIVFSPHPTAAKCTVEAARICLQAAVAAGAPEGLIGWISTPTMEATEALLTHRDVNLILATGGSGLVRAAYSSGKPAYGVGPGNVPVYIEKTAEVPAAVKRIVDSKTFDHGTICASEQSVVVDRNIREIVIREFKKQGAYFLNEEEKKKLEPVISPMPGKLNPKIVGRSAKTIAQYAGVQVPDDTRLLIAEETQVGKDFPFSIEKLAPVFGFYTVDGWKEAVVLCERLLNLGGRGHSLALHTKDEEIARTFALRMPVSRILVNTPSALGAVGATTGLKPSLTLGCGSFGGNITSDNVTAHHLMNVKRLAYGVKELDVPTPTTLTPVQEKTNASEQIEQVIEKVLAEAGTASSQLDKESIAKLVSQVISKL
ncbi:acetaldehyde dehydrogenase (acetylating) [Ammoniphilus sp. YIM 78166]|uniref:acetaldehyde dehydrogenase (acetylating) n=1 Tax=Ammoniphilus sp. YIM 78166 TaxID=1644106 RepID=UPI00106F3091|nr:acetaldehyde dehydrogenase (acetylating) [Ammoniphilus sp. YIM 78166]